jgi:DNA-binding transcriptional LysR family regulator
MSAGLAGRIQCAASADHAGADFGRHRGNLLQDDLDLAIRFGVPQNSSMVARPLAPNRRVLCAAPSYLAGRERRSRPICSGRTASCCSRPAVRPMNGALSVTGGAEPYRSHRRHAKPTTAHWRQWAIEGQGLVMKSIWDVAADLRAGRRW